MSIEDVTIEVVLHNGKNCLSYKSPNLGYEVRATGPIILIEKTNYGYKIVTFGEWENKDDNIVYELHN
jgi:hypothetical protein